MTNLLLAIGGIGAIVLLVRVWTGALEAHSVEDESLASVERRQPYLPRPGAIAVSVIVAGVLFGLSLRYGTATSLSSLVGGSALGRTAIVFIAIIGLGILDQWRWKGQHDRRKHLYGFVVGTLVTWILIAFKRSIFSDVGQDPYLMALGVACIVVGWRFLFGPWPASVKVTVLATFLGWSCYAMLRQETADELLATAIAAATALVPVAIWCWLFLRYHRERMEYVLLAFLAGMLSTAPILFYSALVDHGAQLNFFLFRVIPLNFSASSEAFAKGVLFQGSSPTATAIIAAIVTYLIVGVIEETSKFWVLRRSSQSLFRSIDDVLQLAIVVALGFAFAENLANPTYFVGFVKRFLLAPPTPAWGAFIGSVVGRGVLTTMVHIVSTGVLGYFTGLALYASPVLRDRFSRSSFHPVLDLLHRMLVMRTDMIYARTQVFLGLVVSFVLHGVFDFTVSLAEILPGRPETVGQLLGMPPASALDAVPITLLPAALYIVGGFWLLVYLFERAENLKDYGNIVQQSVTVA